MGVDGKKQLDTSCERCAKREDSSEFQKVVNLKKSGLIIYHHINGNKSVNQKTCTLEAANNISTDVFILQNAKDVEIKYADFIPELEQSKVCCPKCRKILENAKRLLDKVSAIDKKTVAGICDHCKKRAKTHKSCARCFNMANIFIKNKREVKDNTEDRFNLWLSKIKHLLKDITPHDLTMGEIKRRAHSETHINEILKETKLGKDQRDLRTDFKRLGITGLLISKKTPGLHLQYDKSLIYFDSREYTKKQLKIVSMSDSSLMQGIHYSSDDEKISIKSTGKTDLNDISSRAETIPDKKQFIETKENLYNKKDNIPEIETVDLIPEIYNYFASGKTGEIKHDSKHEKTVIKRKNSTKIQTNKSKSNNNLHFSQKAADYSVGARLKSKVDDNLYTSQPVLLKLRADRHRRDHLTDLERNMVNQEMLGILKSATKFVKAHSEEDISTIKASSEVDFHFIFPKIDEKPKFRPNLSSSELIKETQDMLLARTEEEKKKNVEEHTNKQIEVEKRKNALEEKTKVKEEEGKARDEALKRRTEDRKKMEGNRKEEEEVKTIKVKSKAKGRKSATTSARPSSSKQALIDEKSKSKNENLKVDKETKRVRKEEEKKAKQNIINKKVETSEKKPREIEEKSKQKEDKAKNKKEKSVAMVMEDKDEKKDDKFKGKPDKLIDQENILLIEHNKQQENEMKIKKQQNENERKAREAEEKKIIENEILLMKRSKQVKPEWEQRKLKPAIKEAETDQIELKMGDIKVRRPSLDNSILKLVTLKQCDLNKLSKETALEMLKDHRLHHKHELTTCPMCISSDMELDFEEKCRLQTEAMEDIIVGQKIFKYKPPYVSKKEEKTIIPILFESVFTGKTVDDATKVVPEATPIIQSEPKDTKVTELSAKVVIDVEQEPAKGIIRYALSDRTFIDKGWTMLPTEKVVRKMNVYRMRPAHPEFDWFEHNKSKKLMLYETGEKLAEFDDNGRGRWYYRNGNLALDYYDAEEINAQQRFVIYSSGELDERGRTHPITILAIFDYLGNGVVFDHGGKIRLKYNQTEGVVLDRGLGPVSHWKWHTLNDPPVLQQVMIDTQMALKDPAIVKLGGLGDDKPRPDNEEMLAIEFDNFIKEKSKKLSQSFKPFQIKMKALKINKNFSLKVLDQATVYLIFRDGSANLKLNIGMILDHKEIVDTDTADVGDVSNSLERFPARTESLARLQRSVAYAQRFERSRTERERRLRPLEPCKSADELTTAISKPLRPPFRTVPSGSTATREEFICKCNRKPSLNNLYYDTRFV